LARAPSASPDEVVEAAGVEPASWSEQQPNVYVRSLRFVSRLWAARRRAAL